MITAGILVAYCISIGTRSLDNSGSWRIVVGMGLFFALVLGVGIMFVSADQTLRKKAFGEAKTVFVNRFPNLLGGC
jgi:hypothetical protein